MSQPQPSAARVFEMLGRIMCEDIEPAFRLSAAAEIVACFRTQAGIALDTRFMPVAYRPRAVEIAHVAERTLQELAPVYSPCTSGRHAGLLTEEG